MAYTCTPSTLLAAYPKLWALSDKENAIVELGLLCQAVTGGTVATCDPQTVISTYGACYNCMSDKERQVVKLGLLCQLATIRNSTGSIYYGTYGNPNGNQVGNPGDIYIDLSVPGSPVLWMKGSGTGTNTGWA